MDPKKGFPHPCFNVTVSIVRFFCCFFFLAAPKHESFRLSFSFVGFILKTRVMKGFLLREMRENYYCKNIYLQEEIRQNTFKNKYEETAHRSYGDCTEDCWCWWLSEEMIFISQVQNAFSLLFFFVCGMHVCVRILHLWRRHLHILCYFRARSCSASVVAVP